MEQTDEEIQNMAHEINSMSTDITALMVWIAETIEPLQNENAELKEQIERISVTNFDVIKKLKEQIDELKAHCKAVDEVNEKMKCCQNCKHEAVHGVCVSPKKCTNLDKWELAE